MKAALKHIFEDKIKTSMNEEYNGNSIIKQEEFAMVFQQSKNPKKKLNLMDEQRKITRCVICNSKIHWAKNCPRQTNVNSVNIARAISDDDNRAGKLGVLVHESLCS